MNLKTWQLLALLSCLPILIILYFVISGICNEVIGCAFGKYAAEATLTETDTADPVANAEVRANIDYTSTPIISDRKAYITSTNEKGVADLEFSNVRKYPLSVRVSRKEKDTYSVFFVQPEEVELRKTIITVEPEMGRAGVILSEDDKIQLKLDIVRWTPF